MGNLSLTNKQTVVIAKLKKKKFLDDPNLDLAISHKPEPLKKVHLFDNSLFSDIITVNNVIFKRTPKNSLLKIIFGLLLIAIGGVISFLNNFEKGGLIVGCCFVFPGLLTILLAFTRPNRDFILDRINGLVSYPNSWWYKPIVTHFRDISAVLLYEGKLQNPTLKVLTKGFMSTPYRIVNWHPLNFWSFMVWYMDKNRPLPPGDAFDEYRERDFQRRKAAGFPAPIYRSAVPTPEANAQQQEERERYWKDEDYMCPTFKREERSELYNPDIHKDWNAFRYSEKPIKKGSFSAWHRYAFQDGQIVYMRTNERGKGYQPPEESTYEVSVVSVK